MDQRSSKRRIVLIAVLGGITVLAGMGISLHDRSYAKEVKHAQQRDEVRSRCGDGSSSNRSDTLKVRHLQRRLRANRVAEQHVFATTEREAERKLIQRLASAREARGEQSPIREVSPESIGFCDEQLVPSESEQLKAALSTLRFPQEVLELSVSAAVNDPDALAQEGLVTEAAHRIAQATLGAARYAEVFRQCYEAQQTRTEVGTREQQTRAQAIFYRALKFSNDQQMEMTRAAEETLRALYPPAGQHANAEEYFRISMLDAQGIIPSLHPSPDGSGTADTEASPEMIAESESRVKLMGDLWRKFHAIMTDEQRDFLKTHIDEVLPPGSAVFGHELDGVIRSDQAPDQTDVAATR